MQLYVSSTTTISLYVSIVFTLKAKLINSPSHLKNSVDANPKKDDAFFAKQYPCCPALFFQQIPALNPGIWTLIWFVLSFVFFVGFVLAGLATWKQNPNEMRCQADGFLA
jgi:hypothetical protein